MEGLVALPPIDEIDCEIGDDQRDQDGMNLKPRVTSTREAVYGWYPPQWNIYSKPSYKQWDGYSKDYTFNGWYNAYNGAPGAKAPPPPGMGRPPKSPAQKREGSAPTVRQSMPAFRLSRPQSTNSGQELKRQLQQREVAKREQEQGLCVDTRDKSPTRSPSPERQPIKMSLSAERPPRPSPSQMIRQSWQFNKPHDYVIQPMEAVDPIPKPDLRHYGYRYGTPEPSEEDRPRSAVSPSRPKVVSGRPVRSATLRRPKFPSVPDMEKFKEELRRSTTPSTPLAAPESEPSPSPAPSVETLIPEPEATTTRSTRLHRVKSAPPSVRTPSARPETPTPNKEAPEEIPASVERPATTAADRSPQEKDDCDLTYEELVDKYGWKVQIPGDPLNLKKGIIRERLSYTVGCSVPESKQDPPKVHREVWDTFFLNTIPRKPMTFTIAPDWVSEVLHAKRMELQKREGINYRYKDFAFVY